jgi:hypothetical protein
VTSYKPRITPKSETMMRRTTTRIQIRHHPNPIYPSQQFPNRMRGGIIGGVTRRDRWT